MHIMYYTSIHTQYQYPLTNITQREPALVMESINNYCNMLQAIAWNPWSLTCCPPSLTTCLGWPRAWLNDSSTLRSTGANGTQSRASLRKRMRSHMGSAKTLSTQSCRSQTPKKICSLPAIPCRCNLRLVPLDLVLRDRWLVGTEHLKNQSGKVSNSYDLSLVLRSLKNELMKGRSKFPAPIKQKSLIKFLPQWPLIELKIDGQPPKRSTVNLCPRHLIHHRQHPTKMNFPSLFTIYLYCPLRYFHPVYEKCPPCFCCGNVVTDSSGSLGIGTGTGAIITRLSWRRWGEPMERAWMGHISPQIIQKKTVRTFCRISSLRLLMSNTRAFADAVLIISSSATLKVYFQNSMQVTSQNVLSFLSRTHLKLLKRR